MQVPRCQQQECKYLDASNKNASTKMPATKNANIKMPATKNASTRIPRAQSKASACLSPRALRCKYQSTSTEMPISKYKY
eukprot:5764635-Pleurochrysis_carterae.AAC.1